MAERMNPNPGWTPRIPYKNIPNNRGVGGWLNERFGSPFPKGWVGNQYVELDPVLSEENGINVALTPERKQQFISNIYSQRRSDHHRVKKSNQKAANPLNWGTGLLFRALIDDTKTKGKELWNANWPANLTPQQIKELGGTKKRISNREATRLFKKQEDDYRKFNPKETHKKGTSSITSNTSKVIPESVTSETTKIVNKVNQVSGDSIFAPGKESTFQWDMPISNLIPDFDYNKIPALNTPWDDKSAISWNDLPLDLSEEQIPSRLKVDGKNSVEMNDALLEEWPEYFRGMDQLSLEMRGEL